MPLPETLAWLSNMQPPMEQASGCGWALGSPSPWAIVWPLAAWSWMGSSKQGCEISMLLLCTLLCSGLRRLCTYPLGGQPWTGRRLQRTSNILCSWGPGDEQPPSELHIWPEKLLTLMLPPVVCCSLWTTSDVALGPFSALSFGFLASLNSPAASPAGQCWERLAARLLEHDACWLMGSFESAPSSRVPTAVGIPGQSVDDSPWRKGWGFEGCYLPLQGLSVGFHSDGIQRNLKVQPLERAKDPNCIPFSKLKFLWATPSNSQRSCHTVSKYQVLLSKRVRIETSKHVWLQTGMPRPHKQGVLLIASTCAYRLFSICDWLKTIVIIDTETRPLIDIRIVWMENAPFMLFHQNLLPRIAHPLNPYRSQNCHSRLTSVWLKLLLVAPNPHSDASTACTAVDHGAADQRDNTVKIDQLTTHWFWDRNFKRMFIMSSDESVNLTKNRKTFPTPQA